MGMALDEPKEGEQAIQINEIDVLIGEDVKAFTAGNVVDYVDSYGQKGFMIGPESRQGYC